MAWIARSLELIKRHNGAPPTKLFCGLWDERHPLNTPGRFYGAATDTCCDGPALAPASLLYDHQGRGFVWRQPRDEQELASLFRGARSDPFSGYADDGDHHWTPELVRTWWAERPSRQPLVDALVRDLTGSPPASPDNSEEARAVMSRIVAAYLRYVGTELPQDLRKYIAYLETGTHPGPHDELPLL